MFQRMDSDWPVGIAVFLPPFQLIVALTTFIGNELF